MAIGSSTRFSDNPRLTMSEGTGVGSVHTPFSWCFGFVTYSAPGSPVQLVVPTGTPRQYCVCTPAHALPPTPAKKVLRYVCSVLLEYRVPSVSLVVKPVAHGVPQVADGISIPIDLKP